MGRRLAYQVAVVVGARGVVVRDSCLNPWLETYDRFHAHVRARRLAQARALLASQKLMYLLAGASSFLEEEGGDLAKGTGYVVVEDREGNHLRIEFVRKSAGRWMVSAVAKAARRPARLRAGARRGPLLPRHLLRRLLSRRRPRGP
jgi:hypothetical protein